MLSEFQQDTVWQGWLSAEIRAGYFAALVNRFQQRQKFLVVSGLLLSSGATIALLTAVVPPHLGWIKPMLTLLAAGMSLWSLVAKNERNAMDAADLHFRWNTLAIGYEALWADMYIEDAPEKLAKLRKEEAVIPKSSTGMPLYGRLLAKVQDNVVLHHQQHERLAA